MIRRVLLVGLSAIAACTSAVQTPLGSTAARLGDIRSGTLALVLTTSTGAQSVGFRLSGPFELQDGGRLPVARLDYTTKEGARTDAARFISDGKNAYAEARGVTYLLPAQRVDSLR